MVKRGPGGPAEQRNRMRILERDFYARHPSVVARELLGKILVRKIGRKTLAGRIVETEAYSSDDAASHAYRGRTERNRALFEEVGHAYIYLSYGVHYCLNVVAKKGKPAGGVLIRAIEPLPREGLKDGFRGCAGSRGLVSGPGNLTRALRIDLGLYGTDMTRQGPLFIADADSGNFTVLRTPRIGVTSGGEKLWRYVIKRRLRARLQRSASKSNPRG